MSESIMSPTRHRSFLDHFESGAMHKLIEDGEWDLLRQIFQDDAWKPQCFRYLSDRDRYGYTPLHYFCICATHFDYSDKDEMDFINNRNAQNTLSGLELVQAISRNTSRINSTPLDVAYHLLHPNCIFLQDNYGESPLHGLASYCKDPRLMHMVLEYAKTLMDGYGAYYLISLQTKVHTNALHIAVGYGGLALVSLKLILEHCHESVLKSLGREVFKYSHPAFTQATGGDVPLHKACHYGRSFDILETLLNEAPECALWKNEDGQLPIDRFALYREEDFLYDTVRFDEKTNKRIVTETIGEWFSRRDSEWSQEIEEWWKCVSLLLRATTLGTIPPSETSAWQPLHAACQFTVFTTLAFHLACIFCPNEASVPDEQGRLPLHVAAASVDVNCSEKIQMLIQMCPGAASVKMGTGRLPIALAVESGKGFQDIQVLLEAAPETITAIDELTQMYPFMLAAVEGNNSLDTVFHLILSNPSLLQSGIP